MYYELVPPIACPNYAARPDPPTGPHPFGSKNVDLNRESECGPTQWEITRRGGIAGSAAAEPGTVGAVKDRVKVARAIAAKQSLDVASQQRAPQKAPPCGPIVDTDPLNRGPTKSEARVFGGSGGSVMDLRVDLSSPKYPDPPHQGFFELALPPPNPTLLSNVSAERLFATVERFQPTTDVDSDVGPMHTIAASEAIAQSTGSLFGAVTPGFQITGPDTTPRGLQTSVSQPEFQIARSGLEREMKTVIERTIAQQTLALKSISDLRHAITGLEQRIVDSRAHNQAFDVAIATQRLQSGLELIDNLRDAIRALQARRARALDELKGPLTDAEFGSVRTSVANAVQLMEANVRQYHAQPADDSIEAYQRPRFDGDAFVLTRNGAPNGLYDYPNVGGIGNNALQSLKIGANVRVNLFERAHKQGKVITYVGPRRVPLLPTLWNHTVSGIEILEKTGPVVEVWDAPFQQGAKVRLPVGFYDAPDVGGIKSGRTASLSIPDRLNVTIYARPNKSGEKLTFLGPQIVTFLPADWNTKVFGIEVNARGA